LIASSNSTCDAVHPNDWTDSIRYRRIITALNKMEAVNATSSGFSSVLAGTKYANVALPPQVEYVIEAVSNAGVWTWVITFIALCVAYDQSMFSATR
jgi:hypothetical protein